MGLVLGKEYGPDMPSLIENRVNITDRFHIHSDLCFLLHSDFLSICGYSVIFKTNIKAKNKIYQQFNITHKY